MCTFIVNRPAGHTGFAVIASPLSYLGVKSVFSSSYFNSLRSPACGFYHFKVVCTQHVSRLQSCHHSTCGLFVLGQTLRLVCRFGWNWGQRLQAWWKPTDICGASQCQRVEKIVKNKGGAFYVSHLWSVFDQAPPHIDTAAVGSVGLCSKNANG